MTGAVRLSLAARAFFVATVLGLALIFVEPRVFQALVFLAVVAALATVADHLLVGQDRWVALLEGVLAGLIIGFSLPEGAILMPYLIAPPLLAGVAAGARAVVTVAGGQVFGLLLVLTLGASATTARLGIELTAPWAAASIGAGLMGTWVNALRGYPGRGDDASYESARRLLTQLRKVTRRLSSGLDPVDIGSEILQTCEEELGSSRSSLFVYGDAEGLVPLVHRGRDPRQSLTPDGALVAAAVDTLEPQQCPQPSGLAERRHRLVLPVISDGRLIGIVIAEAGSAAPTRLLETVLGMLEDRALRLETALAFDEVRALATVEERQRLAREIHDGVAQEIASLGYLVDDLAANAAGDHQRTKLHALRGEITRVVNELRLSIFDLRSDVNTSTGLGSALSDYVRTVGARSGLTVHLTLDEGHNRLRSEVETELLRITQEAVTNARKHAEAHNLWVNCRVRPPFAEITVEDDGRGLGRPRADSYGISIMKERAHRIGATLQIRQRTAGNVRVGTTVAVTLGDADD
ncbi:ATPase [Nocardioides sp. HDW12B]|uniref:sensor histidine kinase n=1 Tax=Nocardioides sp. HDW12B TaxID=2714939 RepID=UPI001409A259|nr:histidine kinase [Nocardioides sp. HDW12B]QIK66075.1 ATPase [Nocardioides sp. HDW12B]